MTRLTLTQIRRLFQRELALDDHAMYVCRAREHAAARHCFFFAARKMGYSADQAGRILKRDKRSVYRSCEIVAAAIDRRMINPDVHDTWGMVEPFMKQR